MINLLTHLRSLLQHVVVVVVVWNVRLPSPGAALTVKTSNGRPRAVRPTCPVAGEGKAEEGRGGGR